MGNLEKKLSRALTVAIVILAIVCLVLAVKILQGKDATLFGFRIYHILTGSMEPTIRTGSNIIVREVDPDKLEEGDIITFVSRDSTIYGSANTHRIVEIFTDENGSRCFVTKGDANNTADLLYVYPAEIKGKVVYYMRNNGFSTFIGFIRTPMGFFTVIGLPLLVVAFNFMRNFRQQVDEMIRENAEDEARDEGKREEGTKE